VSNYCNEFYSILKEPVMTYDNDLKEAGYNKSDNKSNVESTLTVLHLPNGPSRMFKYKNHIWSRRGTT